MQLYIGACDCWFEAQLVDAREPTSFQYASDYWSLVASDVQCMQLPDLKLLLPAKSNDDDPIH